MREILFRGKRLDNKEWAQGDVCNDYFKIGDTCISERECFGFVQVDPDTVGQYTGQTDKNGVKIFEGDIVRFRGKVYAIEYIKKYARFAGTNPGCIFALFLLSVSEVIGNIHDNPELLEGGSAI